MIFPCALRSIDNTGRGQNTFEQVFHFREMTCFPQLRMETAANRALQHFINRSPGTGGSSPEGITGIWSNPCPQKSPHHHGGSLRTLRVRPPATSPETEFMAAESTLSERTLCHHSFGMCQRFARLQAGSGLPDTRILLIIRNQSLWGFS